MARQGGMSWWLRLEDLKLRHRGVLDVMKTMLYIYGLWGMFLSISDMSYLCDVCLVTCSATASASRRAARLDDYIFGGAP
jgi:hypothetical protein